MAGHICTPSLFLPLILIAETVYDSCHQNHKITKALFVSKGIRKIHEEGWEGSQQDTYFRENAGHCGQSSASKKSVLKRKEKKMKAVENFSTCIS